MANSSFIGAPVATWRKARLGISFFKKETHWEYLALLRLFEENLTFGEEGRSEEGEFCIWRRPVFRFPHCHLLVTTVGKLL